VLYICLNVVALGGGPLFTGWTIDRFANAEFNQGGASFKAECPGGVAAAGASAATHSACHAALVHATRKGMQVTLLFFAWACVHYFLASLGIVRSLKAAALRAPAALASSVQSAST
jgi:hypothetical protein